MVSVGVAGVAKPRGGESTLAHLIVMAAKVFQGVAGAGYTGAAQESVCRPYPVSNEVNTPVGISHPPTAQS